MDGLLAGAAALVTRAAGGIAFSVAGVLPTSCASTLLATSTVECFSSPIPCEEQSFVSYPPEGPSRMKRGSITKFKLNPKRPPKTDWRVFDAMSEEDRHRAALSDPDCPPATGAQLARARRVPTVRALRKKLNLTQEEFAARFHLPLGTVRDWEQGAHVPDKAAQVLLTVIAKDPDAVARALKS
jgi:putative transcriptional regulator